MSPAERAESLVRVVRGTPDAALRVAWLRALLVEHQADVEPLAEILEIVCARAEQADPEAREALVALVDAFNEPACARAVQRLREEAAGVPHLALGRLVRNPLGMRMRDVPPPEDDQVPDYGRGRPLALGERKYLARRTDRDTLSRLLRDPHPTVIERVLKNPKLTEEDVLALASRRPCRPDVLAEIARSPRWAHRPRIRMALVLNPDMPQDLAGPITGLLMRHELRLVMSSPQVPPAVRALCHAHLERRPPTQFPDEPDDRDLQ